MFIIACHKEFCTSNPLQIVLDENNELLKFTEICEADNFLLDKGFSDEVVNDCFFYIDCEKADTIQDVNDILSRYLVEQDWI